MYKCRGRQFLSERTYHLKYRQSYTTDFCCRQKLCIAEAEAEFGPYFQKVVVLLLAHALLSKKNKSKCSCNCSLSRWHLLIIHSIFKTLPTEWAYNPVLSPSTKEVLKENKLAETEDVLNTPHSSGTAGAGGSWVALQRRSREQGPGWLTPVLCVRQKAGLL